MAHGPVNKVWFVKLASDCLFKISETDYDKIRNEHPDAIISVLIGDKTIRCVHLWNGATAELIEDGYELKNNNIYGKMSGQFEFTA